MWYYGDIYCDTSDSVKIAHQLKYAANYHSHVFLLLNNIVYSEAVLDALLK